MGCFRSFLVSFVLSVSFVFSVHGLRQDADTLLQSLGLTIKPDVRKMNVSQEEFSKKMLMYMKRTRRSTEPKRFFTVRPEEVERRESGEELLKFRSEEWGEAEGVTMKMLVQGSSRVNVYQRYDDGSEVLVNTKELSHPGNPLWVDSHLVPLENEDGSASSLIVARVDCGPQCQILEPVVNVVSGVNSGRFKRDTERVGRTDCVALSKKKRCCRHKLDVVFKDLTGYEFIIAPFGFDAGYCQGGCPYRFNAANHHASIQALMYRLGRRGGAPRLCCSPSKFEPLEIIHLDENDPTKLKTTTWDNMKVIECACS